jgi:preprotein translocase subunit YajC
MPLFQDAFAQSTSAASATGNTPPLNAMLAQWGIFIPIILIFYLMLIRPQQQQAKKTKEMLAGLKRGDQVVTSGGLLGTIVGIEEQKVTLHVADKVEMEFVKSAIVNVVPEAGAK